MGGEELEGGDWIAVLRNQSAGSRLAVRAARRFTQIAVIHGRGACPVFQRLNISARLVAVLKEVPFRFRYPT